MSTRIEKEYIFEAAIHLNDTFIINIYEMTLFMSVETSSVREQNVAIERLNFLLGNYIDNCIFVNSENKDAIKKYEDAGIRVCEIPEEPYDQVIGSLLMLKFNSILENKLFVTEIVFGSKISGGIRFELSENIVSREFSGKHWWNENSVSIRNSNTPDKKEKIVNLFDSMDDWAKFDLSWKENKA